MTTAVLARRAVPVELPSLRDPRLHVAACLLTVQVLGQVVVGWDLSIAQLLLSLGTCAAIEVGLVFRQRGVLAWPASALLTGNGVALLLRIPGTAHGDWWSTRGWPIVVGCAAVSVLSKHVLRLDGHPWFNPSNLGLVLVFLVFGSARTEPQDLWWAPWSPGMALVYALLLVGGVVVTRRLGLLGIAAAFWLTFAAGWAALAAAGHGFTATWHVGPVTGGELWTAVALSPELLIFLFFMITDPRTVPAEPVARWWFGAATGAVAVLLAAPQTTEFATKVAILGGLTVVCAVRPLVERLGWRTLTAPIAVGAGVLVLVGPAAAPDLAPGFDAELRAEAVEPVELPPLTVQPSADGLLTAELGAVVAEDLLIDLQLEALALERGDAGLAAAAATAERLEELAAGIDRGTGPAAVPPVERLGLFVHRRLGEHQAAPRIGVVVHPLDGTPSVFTMEPVEGSWLIAGTAPLADVPITLRQR
ncbi:MAG TPA: RnfABCDGE type electron transport complex subunit D [Acidimicrobiales bacterium]|nr:RnfABCDGE type electron transport complex subunit D [Acidimicrobiales bacterium]